MTQPWPLCLRVISLVGRLSHVCAPGATQLIVPNQRDDTQVEWTGSRHLFGAAAQLIIPTNDFAPPSVEDLERACAYIDRHLRRGAVRPFASRPPSCFASVLLLQHRKQKHQSLAEMAAEVQGKAASLSLTGLPPPQVYLHCKAGKGRSVVAAA